MNLIYKLLERYVSPPCIVTIIVMAAIIATACDRLNNLMLSIAGAAIILWFAAIFILIHRDSHPDI